MMDCFVNLLTFFWLKKKKNAAHDCVEEKLCFQRQNQWFCYLWKCCCFLFPKSVDSIAIRMRLLFVFFFPSSLFSCIWYPQSRKKQAANWLLLSNLFLACHLLFIFQKKVSLNEGIHLPSIGGTISHGERQSFALCTKNHDDDVIEAFVIRAFRARRGMRPAIFIFSSLW